MPGTSVHSLNPRQMILDPNPGDAIELIQYYSPTLNYKIRAHKTSHLSVRI